MTATRQEARYAREHSVEAATNERWARAEFYLPGQVESRCTHTSVTIGPADSDEDDESAKARSPESTAAVSAHTAARLAAEVAELRTRAVEAEARAGEASLSRRRAIAIVAAVVVGFAIFSAYMSLIA
jgi:hypothetical protein